MTEPVLGSPEMYLTAVVNGILDGRLVPFLGAGANLVETGGEEWKPGEERRLPSGKELSLHIAKRFSYRHGEPDALKWDLAEVAQFVATSEGRGALDDALHPLFDPLYEPTSLHRFLAQLPSRCRAAEYPRTKDELRKRFLIVTTNYDDVMERAFREIDEKVHVLTYLSNQDGPAFLHQPPEDASEIIRTGTDYHRLDSDAYPIILKVHGSVDRENSALARRENFVITEDDYIDYLSLGDIASALPASVKAQLTFSNFLFLGYALQDWNLRAFLKRIWKEQQTRDFKSWAVMAVCTEFERQYWGEKRVRIVTTDLKDYVVQLDELFTTKIATSP